MDIPLAFKVNQTAYLDIVVRKTVSIRHPYFEVKELLVVDVFWDAEPYCGSPRVPLNGGLLECHR